MKLLVVKRDKLGDMLLATPLLRALRERLPSSEIDVLASEYNAWVVKANPCISPVFSYPRVRIGKRLSLRNGAVQLAQILELRRRKFDAVIVAQGEYSVRAI